MARGYHRLSFRARHVLRQFGKSKNITLQRLHLHELRHAISRKHRFKGPKGKPALGKPGLYQRLSGKARKLITRLRHSRSWQVQKQTVTELEREVQRGERVALAKQARAQRLADRAEKVAKRVQERGRRFRKAVQRAHEPHLARAERKQGERESGKRKPPLSARARQQGRKAARKMQARVRSWRPRRSPHARTPRPATSRPPRTLRPAARPAGRPARARMPRAPRPRPARSR